MAALWQLLLLHAMLCQTFILFIIILKTKIPPHSRSTTPKLDTFPCPINFERILDSAWRSAPASVFFGGRDHLVRRKSQEWQWNFLERKLAGVFRFISLVRKSSTLNRIVLRHNAIPELLVSSHTAFSLLELSKIRFVLRKSQELQLDFLERKLADVGGFISLVRKSKL
jgi:hypothetical protein